MRIAGLFCICLPLALAGLRYSHRSRNAEIILEGFAAFFTGLRLSLAGTEGALETVLSGCITPRPDFPFAGLFGEALRRGKDPSAAWETALSALPETEALAERDRAFLAGFAPAFRCTSLAAFRETCGVFAENCRVRCAEAKQKREREARLIGTLSVLGAALLFILLI